MTCEERILTTLHREGEFLCALATMGTDGAPHVRYVKGVIDDQLTIRCPTSLATQKVQDLRGCANVSVTCGDTDYAVVRIVPSRIAIYPIGGGPAGEIWTADS